MAKNEINRLTGNLGAPIAKVRRNTLEETFRKIDNDLKKPNPIQPGPRQTIIKAYEKGGIEKAYQEAKAINERIGQEAFIKSIVDEWVRDYEKKKEIRNYNQGESRNEDDDAR